MENESINTRLLTRGGLKVKVVKVDSPTSFWVHLENSRENFEEFIEDLTCRMNRRARFLFLPFDRILPGEIVAVREGRGWQRGIVSRIERGDKVTISLRDWGRTIQRSMFEIFQLEDRFRELRWEAIPCSLAHVEPIGGRKRWPRRVINITKHLLEKREGWIRIRRPLRDEAAVVTFEPKHESEDGLRDLKDILVQMGCAQHSTQEITTAVPGISN